jgi:hypothetical protein
MPIPLGILAAAGFRPPAAAGSYDLLQTFTVGSGGLASVTFSNLNTSYASTYRHLQIRFVARASRSGQVGDPVVIKINNATVPVSHHLYGNGSSVISSAPVNYTIIDSIAGTSAATGQFGAGVIDFIDAFSTSKNKTMRALAGGAGLVSLSSALWTSTTITSTIELNPFSNTNFIEGTRFSLYGIKG